MKRTYEEVEDFLRLEKRFLAREGDVAVDVRVTNEFLAATLMTRETMQAIFREQLDRALDDAIEAETVWKKACEEYALDRL